MSHHPSKRSMSDIRPSGFRAPKDPVSPIEKHSFERPSEVSARPETPMTPMIREASELITPTEPLLNPFPSQPSVSPIEEHFGSHEFRTIERNPKRPFVDEEALRPREKPASTLIDETPHEPEALQTDQTLAVKHSFAGRGVRTHNRIRPSLFERLAVKCISWAADVWESVASLSSSLGESVTTRLLSRRYWLGFVAVSVCLWLGSLGYRGWEMRGRVLGVSQTAVDSLQTAVGDLKQKDFSDSQRNFDNAANGFQEASQQLEDWNGTLVEISRFVPVASQLASGKYAISAGRHFALAGSALNGVFEMSVSASKQGIEGLPLLEILQRMREANEVALTELRAAQDDLDKVNIDDLPEDKRAKFLLIRENLPTITQSMKVFLDQSVLLADVFGAHGPRKYLFLLQNNQEARATGGFIGTYALLDIQNGKVRKFFVDGIFNPDGQLTQNIVPPSPLQKVSGAWSLHDSNWFPDFPLSAQKAISFYEKTGGPTVDGVITLTPTVIQKLLALTGPITIDEYGVTLDSDNFMALVQDQVEFRYDKSENKPKKILADLVPLLLDRLTSLKSIDDLKRVLTALESSLNEKHILLYSSNEAVQQQIHEAGWSGEILPAQKDYLSVINTNINGYKTDGVIEQTIQHHAEIDDDGSIIDTVTVTRKHTGGSTPYDFWNRVNADYMRVYVPEGAELLSAEGQTRESIAPPLDYATLRFSIDPDVAREEESIKTDQKTGTRVYAQFGKTVFANWVYVSPGETATIKYTYRLPFRVTSSGGDESSFVRGSYSILFQKQSGSLGSELKSTVSYPKNWKALWETPQNLLASENQFSFERNLQTDRFYGIVFGYLP